jgi:hypothetical protein
MTEPRPSADVAPDDALFRREWLVCNGLGGYASGTIGGTPTRRYHGYLVAALPNPAGRVMMLNSLIEHVRLDNGARADLGWIGPPFAAASRATVATTARSRWWTSGSSSACRSGATPGSA